MDDTDKVDFLDRKFFSIRQLGYALAFCIGLTAVWSWRVAVTHYEFELLKETTTLNDLHRQREEELIREIHIKDIEQTNSRLDKKTARIEEKLKEND